jgi:hypothetical protein
MSPQELNEFMMRTVLSNEDGSAVRHTAQVNHDMTTFGIVMLVSIILAFIVVCILVTRS